MDIGFGHISEDDHILVVNKPAGVGTQAPQAFDSLEARIRRYLAQRSEHEQPYLGIPHRLDRCVSGVIVFAKRKKAAQRLSRQFERREAEKTYEAIVSGNVEPADGCWVDWMRKIPGVPKAECVSATDGDAKQAILHYEVLAQSAGRSHLKIRLETGRMHQIRLQCATRGFPIVGDREYGSDIGTFGPAVTHPRERAIALHAQALVLEHPRTRDRQVFTAPYPAYWLPPERPPSAE